MKGLPEVNHAFFPTLLDRVDCRGIVEGRLPQMFATGGLTQVQQYGAVEAVFGTLTLYSARRRPTEEN